MYYDLDPVLFRRNHSTIFASGHHIHCDESEDVFAALSINVMSLGYVFDHDMSSELMKLPEDELKWFGEAILNELKSLSGADVEYRPMYPCFPQQVAEVSMTELLINALVHYWTYGEWKPSYIKSDRFPPVDVEGLTEIHIGSKVDIADIFEDIVTSETSISPQDEKDLRHIMQKYYSYLVTEDKMPYTIPNKEIAAIVSSEGLKLEPAFLSGFSRYIRTGTDVLRLITAMSEGDVSLSSKTRYRKMNRRERKFIMDLMSFINEANLVEDMYRYREEWLRVGEILHPFEYGKRAKYKRTYSTVVSAFDAIRNHKSELGSYDSMVEAGFSNKSVLQIVELLKRRPGEFARRLDRLVRSFDSEHDVDYILSEFEKVVDSISIPVLLQVRQHFLDRNNESELRVFFPKGVTSKSYSTKNTLPAVDESICDRIAAICLVAIANQCKEKSFMGKVYIDKTLKNYIVPFSQRSASKSVKSITRGSRVSIKDNINVIRSFIWWTNQKKSEDNEFNRVDLDISAVMYDENWRYLSHISYTNLRNLSMRCYHSGDIIDGGDIDGKGAAEFIDIDVQAVIEKGVKYVVFQVYSYNGQTFDSLKNVRFGWMNRADHDSGEVFEPSTLETYITPASNSTVIMPVIFDCEMREFIWCDMSVVRSYGVFSRSNNLENNMDSVTRLCYAMTHLSKPDLYSLVWMNATTRGEVVDKIEEADVAFIDNIYERRDVPEDIEVIYPSDVSYISSNLL